MSISVDTSAEGTLLTSRLWHQTWVLTIVAGSAKRINLHWKLAELFVNAIAELGAL